MKLVALAISIIASIGAIVLPAGAEQTTKSVSVEQAEPSVVDLSPMKSTSNAATTMSEEQPRPALESPPHGDPDAQVGPHDVLPDSHEIPTIQSAKARLKNGKMQVRGFVLCSHAVDLTVDVEQLTGIDFVQKTKRVPCVEGLAKVRLSIPNIELSQGNGVGPHRYQVYLTAIDAQLNNVGTSTSTTQYVVRKTRAQEHGIGKLGWVQFVDITN